MTDTVIKYEERLVAFIDILGWSSACKSEQTPQSLHRVITIIHRIGEAYNEAERSRLLAIEKTGHVQVNPMYMQVRVAVFSDCIAISMPEEFGPRILHTAADVARGLLASGFLCRGGIAKGRIYHCDNLIFGPALIRAVELEKSAFLPVILCAQEVVQQVRCEREANKYLCLMSDPCGRAVVDPFFIGQKFDNLIDQEERIPKMLEFDAIEHSFRVAATALLDEKVRAKWQCAKSMLIQSLRQYGPAAQSMISRLEAI